jgi:hypothetical protein
MHWCAAAQGKEHNVGEDEGRGGASGLFVAGGPLYGQGTHQGWKGAIAYYLYCKIQTMSIIPNLAEFLYLLHAQYSDILVSVWAGERGLVQDGEGTAGAEENGARTGKKKLVSFVNASRSQTIGVRPSTAPAIYS